MEDMIDELLKRLDSSLAFMTERDKISFATWVVECSYKYNKSHEQILKDLNKVIKMLSKK